MAIILTKSYQKISTVKLTYGEIRTYAKFTNQNTVTNQTAYYLKTTYYVTGVNQVHFSSATAKLDGVTKSYGDTYMYKGETTIQELSRVLTHNANGSSPDKIVSTSWSSTFGGSGSTSTTIKMPTIKRIATITSSTDFTDEGNPIVYFNNPAGFTVKPFLNIYNNNNSLVYSLGRSNATSPFTWDITDTERESLRNSTNQQKSYKVAIGVDTFNGSTKLGSHSIAKIMTYINAQPSQVTVFEETNQKVIDIFGDSIADTIIQNVSNLRMSSTPTVLKGATTSKIQFEHNNISVAKTNSPYEYTFIPVNSTFKTIVTDSRGYIVSNTYTKDIIEYLPIDILSFSFKRVNPVSSDVVLNAQIRYKQTSFNGTSNIPTIKWKKGDNGNLNEISESSYSINAESNIITISNLVIADIIPYTEEDRFYLYVNDLLTEDTENEPILKGIPTFEAGEHDFQVNGELYIADINRENKKNIGEILKGIKSQKILWSGGYYMSANHSVELSETITEQGNGIVLLWSAYVNGASQNYDFALFFIPKIFVSLFPGCGINMTMANSSLTPICTKYCYIGNQIIMGAANNEKSGTSANGIVFNNKYWVLRAVIGV